METNEKFFEGLSAAEWDQAEAIETEIAELLGEGFTEEVGLKFVRTVMEIRKAIPNATVGGVFDAALKAGLSDVAATVVIVQAKQVARKRNVGGKRGNVSGVRGV